MGRKMRAGRAVLVSRLAWVLGVAVAMVVGGGMAVVICLRERGISARSEPFLVEALTARALRRLAIPVSAREAGNPVPKTPEVLAEARAHFADHCAICHANDGSGSTTIGRNLYPKAPDMRDDATQGLTDGELFYLIHNGIRLSGMPGWGSDDPDSRAQTWKLVHFLRHLPELSEDEAIQMEALNPKSRHELREEDEARRFLEEAEEQAGAPIYGDH